MKILAIEASGQVAAVALAESGRLVAEYRIDHRKTHSQTLVPMLNELRRMTELDLHTLDAIAVTAGPGSFTGLRIGAATAKGMAYALHIPIVPVPTTDAIAWQLYGEEGIICPMMDARRDQVYTGLYCFHTQKDGRSPRAEDMEVLIPACAVPVEEILRKIDSFGREVIFLGDGVAVSEAAIRERLSVPYRFAPSWKNRQDAAALADLGALRYAEGHTVAAEDFTPVYLRASQAEREAAERKKRESSDESADREEERTGSSGVVIRRMTAEEVPGEAVRETACLGREAWSERQLLDVVARRDCVYLVAETDGHVIGHAGVRCVCGTGEVTNVCVDKDRRRQGVGGMLIRELILRGAGIGIDAYTLEVRASNAAALKLYEKSGFVREGVRPGFYEDPADDAVILWRRDERDGV
ncbi:MAG: tRNA (adenosine(37)-N6)-threonylcarbamoyltransferase complex dimerization subunit type 1 TsaB [Lachnospiraceae bacterium]|nr:tRNA (adenosine(37)-N6)-threonylcarbamoyltransferase complex dimerization subunit type 1 TsaB [Lachnospiraceae bacterium]